MGAGASTSDLPEKLTEEDLKRICGDKYEDIIYKSLCDSEGNVSREQFLHVVSDNLEKEVFHVYQSFCPHGDIDSRTFVKLCKDAKLTNKKNFTVTDCDLMFQKAKSQSGVTTKTLNYSTFRQNLVEEIAKKKSMEATQILTKIARVEGPTLHGTKADAVKFHDDKSTFTGAHAQGGPNFKAEGSAVQMEELLDRGEADVRGVASSGKASGKAEAAEAPAEHHRAAIRVQTMHRKNTAKKLIEGIKEVRTKHTFFPTSRLLKLTLIDALTCNF